jgi:DNA-binding ferritin-like protein
MNHKNITSLVAFNVNLQLAHWQADTRTNAHKTLGDLYEQLNDLLDMLAEVTLGKDGNVSFESETLQLTPNVSHGELLSVGRTLCQTILDELDEEKDCDLENIIADMLISINRAAYLLKV